jgi:hypothetical protein
MVREIVMKYENEVAAHVAAYWFWQSETAPYYTFMAFEKNAIRIRDCYSEEVLASFEW